MHEAKHLESLVQGWFQTGDQQMNAAFRQPESDIRSNLKGVREV